jgi:type IV pilus assembly protein PilC
MAGTSQARDEDRIFEWQGKDRNGKTVRGELRSSSPQLALQTLHRRGVLAARVSPRKWHGGRRIRAKDIAIFTRQLATLIRAGVPLLQAFDIVGRGHPNPRMGLLLSQIRADVETGTSLAKALARHGQYFNALYCNLVDAGEAAGILDELLTRLAIYLEKIQATKSKIRSAMMYPLVVLLVALGVISLIMLFVVPAFKEVFASFGAPLPVATQMVITLSELFSQYWWLIAGGLIIAGHALRLAWRRSAQLQAWGDRALLRLPVFGPLLRKSILARWTRTLATMFSAGVPLVESLDSVGAAAGSHVYQRCCEQLRRDVASGISLTQAMEDSQQFPSMVLQMVLIGEESGTLDDMLAKAADFYDSEVDDMVAGLSSLMEPVIIVVLGVLIGGLVVSMYLPIFQLGQVV